MYTASCWVFVAVYQQLYVHIIVITSLPFQYNGGSAAQSSTFQTFDVALGIEHEPSMLAHNSCYMLTLINRIHRRNYLR